MPKVLITPRSYGMFNKDINQMWEKAGFEVIREAGPLPESKFIELIKDVDALLIGTDCLNEKILYNAKHLKIISKYGTGIDNIPKEYAVKKGIYVTNTPAVNNEAVADYAFGLMLSTARSISSSAQKLREGQWTKTVGIELFGKTLGILGFGAIGKAVARRAKGFQMDVIVYDVFSDKKTAEEYGITYADLETVLKNCDFLSIHMPLLPETTNLLNYETMKKMKKEAIIINTARGGIVNEQDLFRVLQEGIIRGAGIDVFSVEPPNSSPLLELDNAVLTPHNAAASEEAIERMTLQSTRNIIEFFEQQVKKTEGGNKGVTQI
ncbi:phosphoglycerate dehydrogenase [Priestia megaterium]|uniref:phosphoglycerate dehydrogenase n=1 Tax=Priestia megaterium TaxID=1404 RepID=UPI000BF651E4|nr:phosphoglycerate dehydrogenase [Priestia megaterium]NGY70111.1 phosphoglycerate dehydrogenase [Priestia megaterium]PFT49516.1 hydroxyacid dehydrogenase [Priestia megaterium]